MSSATACELPNNIRWDGEADIEWHRGKERGKATCRLKIRAPIETKEDAEDVEAALPGTVAVWKAGRAGDEGEHPSGLHTQRTDFEDVGRLTWKIGAREVDGFTPPAPVEVEADIASLTVSANAGTITGTLVLRFDLPIEQLSAIEAIAAQPVSAAGRSRQQTLPLGVKVEAGDGSALPPEA